MKETIYARKKKEGTMQKDLWMQMHGEKREMAREKSEERKRENGRSRVEGRQGINEQEGKEGASEQEWKERRWQGGRIRGTGAVGRRAGEKERGSE